MTSVHKSIIEGKAAWKAADLPGGKAALTHKFSEKHLSAFDRLLKGVRGIPVEQIKKAQFTDPLIAEFAKEVLEDLEHGHGIVVVSGVTRDRYTPEEFEAIYWGFGLHLGRTVSQSAFGELIAHVRKAKENPNNRTYRTSREIKLHNDMTDLIGLMCVQKAKSGGITSVVSALAIHNEILRTRPELLEPLYRGFEYDRLGQQLEDQPRITPYRVPVFSQVNGIVSCRYVRWLMEAAGKEMNRPLPEDFVKAIDYFDEIASRPDFALTFEIEPGEMMIQSNYTTLHARTEFDDHEEPERKRHLLRIWWEVTDSRPSVREMDPFQQAASGGRGGIAKREKITAVV